jgi:hypothetical protein
MIAALLACRASRAWQENKYLGLPSDYGRNLRRDEVKTVGICRFLAHEQPRRNRGMTRDIRNA